MSETERHAMILVTTAGKVGSETVRLLGERQLPVRVLVRDPAKARAGAGRRGRGDRRGRPGRAGEHRRRDEGRQRRGPGQPGRARPGAERRRQRRPGQRRACRQGDQQGVGGLAHRPAALAGRDRGGLAASGMPHTLLRSNAYMQNILMLAPAIAKTSSFGSSAGKGRVGMVDARDVAAVAAGIAAVPAAARRADVLAHRPGADHQRRRGRRAVQAARPDHRLPASSPSTRTGTR